MSNETHDYNYTKAVIGYIKKQTNPDSVYFVSVV